MNSTVNGAMVKPAKGGTHGFFPDFKNIETGFLSIGPGINQGKLLSKMALEDIAPIVSTVLKLNMQKIDPLIQKEIFIEKK